MTGLSFKLFFLDPLSDRRVGQAAVRSISQLPTGLQPTRYGVFEPKHPIVGWGEVAETLLNRLPDGRPTEACSLVLDSDSEVNWMLQWNAGDRHPFSTISGFLESGHLSEIKSLVELLVTHLPMLACSVGATYGEVRGITAGVQNTPINLFARLPDIPAVSIYGHEYVDLFGREKIMSAPFLEARPICADTYWLRASEDVLTAVSPLKSAEIREHLGAEAFMVGKNRTYRSGLAPIFQPRSTVYP